MKKPLNWPTTKAESDYMRMRQAQNRARIGCIPGEEWMAAKLAATGRHWTRHAAWGYRLFDFWCAAIGVAVEVDGPGHHKGKDRYRDDYNFQRSGILVLRVRNFSEEDATTALDAIVKAGVWSERRKKLGLTGRGKKEARKRWMHSDEPTFEFS